MTRPPEFRGATRRIFVRIPYVGCLHGNWLNAGQYALRRGQWQARHVTDMQRRDLSRLIVRAYRDVNLRRRNLTT